MLVLRWVVGIEAAQRPLRHGTRRQLWWVSIQSFAAGTTSYFLTRQTRIDEHDSMDIRELSVDELLNTGRPSDCALAVLAGDGPDRLRD